MATRLSDDQVFSNAADEVENKLHSRVVDARKITPAVGKLRTIALKADNWDPAWTNAFNAALRKPYPHHERWSAGVVVPLLVDLADCLDHVKDDEPIDRQTLIDLRDFLQELSKAFRRILDHVNSRRVHAQEHHAHR